jgi:DNA-binding CsgD family transcriptional regulator
MVTDGPLSDHFATLGVDAAAVRVYRHLLMAGASGAPDLVRAGLLGADELPEANAILAALTEAGLIAPSGESGERFAPVPPEAGLRALTARREGELNEATVAVVNAYRESRRQQQVQSIDDLVEVVTGPAILERIRQAELHTYREIRRLDSPPYYRLRPSNDTELDHLARGIGYRVVYSRSSLSRDDYLESNIVPCMKAGEQARVLAEVPVKLSLIDDTLALVSLSIAQAEVNRSLLIVRPSTLFNALVGLFEVCWKTALPILPSDAAGSPIEPIEQRMLGLLAAGMSDEIIIRTLRISRRTFFRYLEKLQTRAGVNTRFQLGIYASREGWLPDSTDGGTSPSG